MYSGKVRDIYDAGDGRLLMVTSDRISAFDVVMDEPIPDKGRVLTAMSAFWFEHLADVARQPPGLHRPRRLPAGGRLETRMGRAGDAVPPGRDAARRVHRARLPHRFGVEGVPGRRARCTASPLPSGMQESDRLPEPVFTPSTKAEVGDHDENISFERGGRPGRQGAGRAGCATCRSSCYQRGAEWAAERGIIIADTKFELGLIDGELVLADEVLTPDSSPLLAGRRSGCRAPRRRRSTSSRCATTSTRLDWDKKPPPPPLPAEVVDRQPRPLRRGLRAHHRPVASPTGPAPTRLQLDAPLGRELRRARGRGCPGGRRRPRSGWAAGRSSTALHRWAPSRPSSSITQLSTFGRSGCSTSKVRSQRAAHVGQPVDERRREGQRGRVDPVTRVDVAQWVAAPLVGELEPAPAHRARVRPERPAAVCESGARAVRRAGRGPSAGGRGRPAGADHRALAAPPRLRRRRGRPGRQVHPLRPRGRRRGAARAEVEDMCARFLTNPVIEDAEVTIRARQEAAA